MITPKNTGNQFAKNKKNVITPKNTGNQFAKNKKNVITPKNTGNQFAKNKKNVITPKNTGNQFAKNKKNVITPKNTGNQFAKNKKNVITPKNTGKTSLNSGVIKNPLKPGGGTQQYGPPAPTRLKSNSGTPSTANKLPSQKLLGASPTPNYAYKPNSNRKISTGPSTTPGRTPKQLVSPAPKPSNKKPNDYSKFSQVMQSTKGNKPLSQQQKNSLSKAIKNQKPGPGNLGERGTADYKISPQQQKQINAFNKLYRSGGKPLDEKTRTSLNNALKNQKPGPGNLGERGIADYKINPQQQKQINAFNKLYRSGGKPLDQKTRNSLINATRNQKPGQGNLGEKGTHYAMSENSKILQAIGMQNSAPIFDTYAGMFDMLDKRAANPKDALGQSLVNAGYTSKKLKQAANDMRGQSQAVRKQYNSLPQPIRKAAEKISASGDLSSLKNAVPRTTPRYQTSIGYNNTPEMQAMAMADSINLLGVISNNAYMIGRDPHLDAYGKPLVNKAFMPNMINTSQDIIKGAVQTNKDLGQMAKIYGVSMPATPQFVTFHSGFIGAPGKEVTLYIPALVDQFRGPNYDANVDKFINANLMQSPYSPITITDSLGNTQVLKTGSYTDFITGEVLAPNLSTADQLRRMFKGEPMLANPESLLGKLSKQGLDLTLTDLKLSADLLEKYTKQYGPQLEEFGNFIAIPGVKELLKGAGLTEKEAKFVNALIGYGALGIDAGIGIGKTVGSLTANAIKNPGLVTDLIKNAPKNLKAIVEGGWKNNIHAAPFDFGVATGIDSGMSVAKNDFSVLTSMGSGGTSGAYNWFRRGQSAGTGLDKSVRSQLTAKQFPQDVVKQTVTDVNDLTARGASIPQSMAVEALHGSALSEILQSAPLYAGPMTTWTTKVAKPLADPVTKKILNNAPDYVLNNAARWYSKFDKKPVPKNRAQLIEWIEPHVKSDITALLTTAGRKTIADGANAAAGSESESTASKLPNLSYLDSSALNKNTNGYSFNNPTGSTPLLTVQPNNK